MAKMLLFLWRLGNICESLQDSITLLVIFTFHVVLQFFGLVPQAVALLSRALGLIFQRSFGS